MLYNSQKQKRLIGHIHKRPVGVLAKLGYVIHCSLYSGKAAIDTIHQVYTASHN